MAFPFRSGLWQKRAVVCYLMAADNFFLSTYGINQFHSYRGGRDYM